MKDRLINIEHKFAQLKNLNHSPEKSGDELVERVDLSLEFLIETDELDMIIDSSLPVRETLFDKDGNPALRELGVIALSTKAEGRAYFGRDKKDRKKFDLSVLKKIKVDPINDRRAVVTAQIRVDPGEHLVYLGHLRVEQECVFSFSGSTDKSIEKNDDQEEMNV